MAHYCLSAIMGFKPGRGLSYLMVQAAEVESHNDNGLHTQSELQIRELCYPSPLFLPAPIVIGV